MPLRHSLQRSLRAPAAGFRHAETGILTRVGTDGWYLSASPDTAATGCVGAFSSSSSRVNPLAVTNRAFGDTVRCVQHLHRSRFCPRKGVFFRSTRPPFPDTRIPPESSLFGRSGFNRYLCSTGTVWPAICRGRRPGDIHQKQREHEKDFCSRRAACCDDRLRRRAER